LNFLNHLNNTPQTQITCLHIELRPDVVFRAITGTGSALDRFFQSLYDNCPIDHLLGCHRIGNRQKLGLVRGNGASHQSCSSCSKSVSSSIISTPALSSGAVAAISLSVKSSLALCT